MRLTLAIIFSIFTALSFVFPVQARDMPADPSVQDDFLENKFPSGAVAARFVRARFAQLKPLILACPRDQQLDWHSGVMPEIVSDTELGKARAAARLLSPARDEARKKLARYQLASELLAQTIINANLTTSYDELFEQRDDKLAFRTEAQAQLEWYKAGFELRRARDELRSKQARYAGRADALYQRLPQSKREALLQLETKRLQCLVTARRKQFASLSALRANSLAVDAQQKQAYFSDRPWTLEIMALAASYNDLVAETHAQAHIVSRMANAHAQALINAEILLAEQRYFEDNPSAPAYNAPNTARPARLAAAKARAWAYYGHLARDEISAEAMFTAALHWGGGTDIVVGNLSGEAKRLFQSVVDAGSTPTSSGEYDPEIMALVSLALGKKFFGNALDVLVIAPLTDGVIEQIGKPIAASAGLTVKTAQEQALVKYQQALRNHKARGSAVLNFIEHHDYARALSLAQFLGDRKGGADTTHLATMARGTMREMLVNHKTVYASDGGWAKVLTPICENHNDLTALWHRTMRISMEGLASETLFTLAGERGQSTGAEPGQTVKKVDQAVLEAFLDVRPEWIKKYKVDVWGDTHDPWQMISNYSYNTVMNAAAQAEGLAWLATQGLSLGQNVKNLVGYIGEGADFDQQNKYLERLVQYQDRWDRYIKLLAAADFNIDRAHDSSRPARQLHMMITGSFEPIILAEGTVKERRLARLKARLPFRSEDGRPNGTAIADIEMQHVNLRHKMALQRAVGSYQHHLLSNLYLEAVGSLQKMEGALNAIRAKNGLQGKVDLGATQAVLKQKAVFNEAQNVYVSMTRELYEELLLDGLTDFLSNGVASRITDEGIYKHAVPSPEKWAAQAIQDATREKLYAAFNPFAGKASWSGAMGVMQSSFVSAAAKTAGQSAKQASGGVVASATVEKTVDVVFTIVKDTVGKNGQTIEGDHAQWDSDTRFVEPLISTYDAMQTGLKSAVQDAKRSYKSMRLAMELWKQGDPKPREIEATARKLISIAHSQEAAARRSAMNRFDDGVEVEQAKRRETAETARMIALADIQENVGQTAQPNKRSRKLAETAAELQRIHTSLTRDTPDVATLRRLVDPSDPAKLRDHLLTAAMPVDALRTALKNAQAHANKSGDQAALAEVIRVAEAADDYRIAAIDKVLNEFMQGPDAANVALIVQGGAAKGNPEYQGIFADIDFTLFTKPGVTTSEAEATLRKLIAKFEEAGLPLATDDNGRYSPMDAEGFIQPLGRFNSRTADTIDVFMDVALNQKSPTRFYTEAGGKWFINNAIYSGKKLAGEGSLGDWVHLRREEGMGLAIDMARNMSFVANARYQRAQVSQLPKDKQRKVLGKALSKTKYFLRLLDAYLIADEDGNEIYNKRLANKTETGKDASYHWQIYKDLQKLGDKADLLDAGDLAMIEQLARMKMKGENPSPWDVFYGGSEDLNNQQLARAQDMMDMMQRLTVKILARTSNVAMTEGARLREQKDSAGLRARMADYQRMMSTITNTLTLDPNMATMMMVPPAKVTPQDEGGWGIEMIGEQDHVALIQRNMRVQSRVLQDFAAELDEAMKDREGDDPLGKEKEARVKTVADKFKPAENQMVENWIGFYDNRMFAALEDAERIERETRRPSSESEAD